MKRGRRYFVVLVAVGCLLMAGQSARPQTYTVLHTFTNTDGAVPYATLALDGSTLYGSTHNGGSDGIGTLFKVNTDGSGFTMLQDFDGTNGAFPTGELTVSGSTLYGTGGGDRKSV